VLKVILFVALLIYVYRRWLTPSAPRSVGRHARREQHRGVESVDTVKCARCGVYVPRIEATRNGDLWYCCAEHEREARRDGR
jgi:hypothetical protein